MTYKPTYPYIYNWGNNTKRAKYKGMPCRVIVRYKLNSVLVEFANGDQIVTSRNAIRKDGELSTINEHRNKDEETTCKKK